MTRTEQKMEEFYGDKTGELVGNYEGAFEMMCKFAAKLENELNAERKLHFANLEKEREIKSDLRKKLMAMQEYMGRRDFY